MADYKRVHSLIVYKPKSKWAAFPEPEQYYCSLACAKQAHSAAKQYRFWRRHGLEVRSMVTVSVYGFTCAQCKAEVRPERMALAA